MYYFDFFVLLTAFWAVFMMIATRFSKAVHPRNFLFYLQRAIATGAGALGLAYISTPTLPKYIKEYGHLIDFMPLKYFMTLGFFLSAWLFLFRTQKVQERGPFTIDDFFDIGMVLAVGIFMFFGVLKPLVFYIFSLN